MSHPRAKFGVKMWGVMCGTKGKELFSCHVLRIRRGRDAVLCDPVTGEENGWSPISGLFLTRAQAVADWRRRADAETIEHADAIERAADDLHRTAERIRAKARPIGPWQDR